MTHVSTIETLRRQLLGRVIEPGQPDYDDARRTFYGGIDRRPAHIVRPAGAVDVARTIQFARDSGLELAVRSGGHSVLGHCVTDGGVVIDLREMRGLTIDPAERTAWAETGLTALEYSAAAHYHGLATGFGDTGSVGIGGLTVGGGVGYLSRKLALTIDSLLAAQVVTADGDILQVDAENHPDPFWGFRFRLHELDTVVGGMLMLPATADVVAEFIALAEAAPEELSTIANVMPAPPMPFLPSETVGRRVILAFLVYAGPVVDGEHAVAPFRALAAPIADMLQAMPYPAIYPPEDPSYHPTAASRTMFVDTLDGRAALTVVEHLEESTAKFQVAQIRVLGGAVARVPSDATAYAHRARPIMVNVAALYDQAEEASTHEAWAEKFWKALRNGEPGAYVNFLSADGPARMREAYPGRTLDRLAEIKARYDPTNVFRLNQNVAPARSAAAQGS
ncbi:MAG: FAD-binding oxidoreductase [Chloroflexi bacterium]|nr:MAG: FAD-binding oxidoreductase [Chloroflexota bacterium]